ncbi:MAG TPA: hypothetical protein VMY77_08320 [Chitinophagaceae bacterium]|nr:hypothetical protein [Chitinophagaceae bacterium]
MAARVELLYNTLQVLIVFTSLTYGIIYWGEIKQHVYLKLLPIYTAVSLSLSLLWFFKKINFPVILQHFFIPFEFFIFYNFFIKVLKNKKNYYILISLSTLFYISLIIIAALLYSNQNKYLTVISFFNNKSLPELIVIENIFIGIPVLLYYISLFNHPYIQKISADPIFLVMTGILFCMVLSTPVFVFQNIIVNNNRQVYQYLYIINSIAYIVMHLFFIKAYKSIK